MKILNFGSCNVDHVYRLHHIVANGETERSETLNFFPGGKGLNQSIALARSGAKIYHAACIGYDGDFLLKMLNENGVDTSLIRRVNAPNGHAIIQVSDAGENSIIIHAGSNGMITEDYIQEVFSHFEQGDFLVLQNEINNLPAIIKTAKEKGIRIIFNPSPMNETIQKMNLDDFSYIILNEVEAEALSGKTTPEAFFAWSDQYHPKVKFVLTLGSKGCIYHDAETTCSHPAGKVKVVDTTAAGDTFLGYFVAAIAEGMIPKDAIALASAASAVTVSRPGASPSIPTRDEIQMGKE